jgi:lysozyme family protein
MTLDDTLNTILQDEGGYVNNGVDRGGPTNMGVTLPDLSTYLGRPATIEDLKGLTVEEAKEIFTRNYISGPRIDSLPDAIVPVVADASVLYGSGRAIKFVQNVVNSSGFGIVDVDGVIGPQTRQKAVACYGGDTPSANNMGPYMVNAIVNERLAFNAQIVAATPSQGVFKDGWDNRANRFMVQVQ